MFSVRFFELYAVISLYTPHNLRAYTHSSIKRKQNCVFSWLRAAFVGGGVVVVAFLHSVLYYSFGAFCAFVRMTHKIDWNAISGCRRIVEFECVRRLCTHTHTTPPHDSTAQTKCAWNNTMANDFNGSFVNRIDILKHIECVDKIPQAKLNLFKPILCSILCICVRDDNTIEMNISGEMICINQKKTWKQPLQVLCHAHSVKSRKSRKEKWESRRERKPTGIEGTSEWERR